jgi:hypothetical protein
MPDQNPLTNVSAALRDVIAAVQHVRNDIKWPEAALAQARATFNTAIGEFLTTQGRLHPKVDLWNGPAFAPFRNFVLREVVPEVVNAAAEKLPAPGDMRPDVFAAAASRVLHLPQTIKGTQDILTECFQKAGLGRIVYACPSPIFETRPGH